MLVQEKAVLGENLIELKRLIKRAEIRQEMKTKYKKLNEKVSMALKKVSVSKGK